MYSDLVRVLHVFGDEMSYSLVNDCCFAILGVLVWHDCIELLSFFTTSLRRHDYIGVPKDMVLLIFLLRLVFSIYCLLSGLLDLVLSSLLFFVRIPDLVFAHGTVPVAYDLRIEPAVCYFVHACSADPLARFHPIHVCTDAV
jgi:hypothetical protein